MVQWGRKKDEEFGALEFEEYKPPQSEYTPPGTEYSQYSDGEAVDEAKPIDQELQGQAQEVMNDNLELMKVIVTRIREDEEFARNIYKDCPRLQELLRKNPDLRPLFEDPKFIVINFEQVFRNAGGVLPGDPPVKLGRLDRIKQTIGAITSHPLFKVFKYLMLIKKIVFMFSPTKVFGFVTSFFCPSVEDLENMELDAPNPEAAKAKIAINEAAAKLEDPELQAEMAEVCDDPDKMEELIENNQELRDLRDSNPLCAEMMNDPETFRIICDPENLRALSDAPELLEMDFADPDWTPEPDLDADMDVNAEVEGGLEAEGDFEAEGEYEDEEWERDYSEEEDEDYLDEEEDEEDYLDEEEDDEDEGGIRSKLEDHEFEREEGGEEEMTDRNQKNRGQRARGSNKNRDEDEEEGGNGRAKGFMAGFVGAGLGVMGGALFEDMDALFGGGDDDLGDIGVEDAGGEAEGAAVGGGFFEDYGGGEEEEENELLAKIEELEYDEKDNEGEDELMNQIEDAEYKGEEEKRESMEDEGDPQLNDHLLETVEEVDYQEAEGEKQDDQEGGNLATGLAADGFEAWDGPVDNKDNETDRGGDRSVASGPSADDSRSYDTGSQYSEDWIQYGTQSDR